MTTETCFFCDETCDANKIIFNPFCGQCGSPVSKTVKINLLNDKQRSVDRSGKNGSLIFFTEWPSDGQAGNIKDLSPNGLSFESQLELDTEKVIKIDSSFLQAVAKVCYCQQDEKKFSIGVEFITVEYVDDSGMFTLDNKA